MEDHMNTSHLFEKVLNVPLLGWLYICSEYESPRLDTYYNALRHVIYDLINSEKPSAKTNPLSTHAFDMQLAHSFCWSWRLYSYEELGSY